MKVLKSLNLFNDSQVPSLHKSYTQENTAWQNMSKYDLRGYHHEFNQKINLSNDGTWPRKIGNDGKHPLVRQQNAGAGGLKGDVIPRQGVIRPPLSSMMTVSAAAATIDDLVLSSLVLSAIVLLPK